MRTPARPAAAAASPGLGAASLASPGEDFVARVVTLEPGFYAFTLAGSRRWQEPIIGLPLPAIHVCEAEGDGVFEITDEAGRPGSWLGGGSTVLFVKSRQAGAALVTAFLPREPEALPVELELRRLDAPGDDAIGASEPDALPPLMTLRLGAADAAAGSGSSVPLDVVAHIRARGDVRFSGSGVIGRLGPGQWIEAFTIGSPDPAATAVIEYKGLSASGSETPWLGCGSTCGETGAGVPLLGFAIRQKAAAGSAARFDCEYAGYFQSGAVVGPLRNGAPCLSPHDNDPLEGMTLSIVPRPARGGPSA
jgi:hypothetical protein